jgi:hypothetical protein
VRVESLGPEIEGPGGLSQSPKPLRLKQEILDRELDRVYEAKTLRGEFLNPWGSYLKNLSINIWCLGKARLNGFTESKPRRGSFPKPRSCVQ